ncbi:hypothetical protein J2Z22_001140 [Paenibacillus forsythiae]|uniref:Uncharacterized protein n=1 Tax=Paenibacillus forsythiae TaxID=365616 RepID=A0ABU3H479_9BACL|nr:hypothetical protein [Paenibacillus forsythiae]MDT3425621.1 hypothetical protein [Paenibacillus forsythiae]
MTQYIDFRMRNGLIRLVLVIFLAIALPASAFADWIGHAAQKSGTESIDRQERHLGAVSARLHPPQHLPAPASRLSYEPTAAAMPEPYLLPGLAALFYPLIVKLLKRLLLYPLKYTSNYVASAFGS